MQTTESNVPSLKYCQCVSGATVEILRAACNLELQSGNEPVEAPAAEGVIIGVLSLVGDVDWSIFLGLPRQTAPDVVARFAGFEVPFDSEDMGDAVGEMTNILAGEIKRRLVEKNVSVMLSLPSVLRAESMKMVSQRNSTVMQTWFASDVGALWTGVVFTTG